jgi:hypothetical protein
MTMPAISGEDQWSIGFDVVERYRGLRDFYRQAGWSRLRPALCVYHSTSILRGSSRVRG